MQIDTVMLADAAAEAAGKLNILGAGISRIIPQVLPAPHPQLTLVIRALIEDDDFDRAHPVRIEALGPNGESFLPTLNLEIPIEKLQEVRDLTVEGELRVAQLIVNLQGATFAVEGVHEFVVHVDDQVARYPVVVTVAAPKE